MKMATEDTKNESLETTLSGDFTCADCDKEAIPQADRKSIKVLTELIDESSTDISYSRRRFLLSVFFASVFLFAGSISMTFVLMKNRSSQDAALLASSDPESSSFSGEDTARPDSNNTQTDVSPVSAPANIPSPTAVQNVSAASSLAPILSPTRQPTLSPTDTGTIIIYALGDLPYSDEEALGLEAMMDNVPSDADLVIHVGDIRLARGRTTCLRSEYESVRDLFRRSHAPVLLVMGDNEWNDCSNVDEGYRYWKKTFVDFEKEWPSTPQLQRWSQYPESFHFTMRGVLFIGLNLVGGLVHDAKEWRTRLEYQYTWTRELILEYSKDHGDAAKVVLIGHCDPTNDHRQFFHPFTNFVNVELGNRIPILYLNGDQHVWDLRYDYLGAPGLMRVMVVGGSKEAPARIEINTQEETSDPRLAFAVQRNSYPFGR